MTRADNCAHLRRAVADRHESTLQRARIALAELDRTGQLVTFTTVARTAHVSRSWLYDQPDLRATISRLTRSTTAAAQPDTPSAQRATPDSIRQRLDLARHEITKLRAQNNALRDQLALLLGQQRARR